jgi:hypothetical protein
MSGKFGKATAIEMPSTISPASNPAATSATPPIAHRSAQCMEVVAFCLSGPVEFFGLLVMKT